MTSLLSILLICAGGAAIIFGFYWLFNAPALIADLYPKTWWIFALGFFAGGILAGGVLTSYIPETFGWLGIIITVLSVLAIYFSYLILWFRFKVARIILTVAGILLCLYAVYCYTIKGAMLPVFTSLNIPSSLLLGAGIGILVMLIFVPWIAWVILGSNTFAPTTKPTHYSSENTPKTCRDCKYYWTDIDLAFPVCNLHEFHFQRDFTPCDKFVHK